MKYKTFVKNLIKEIKSTKDLEEKRLLINKLMLAQDAYFVANTQHMSLDDAIKAVKEHRTTYRRDY